MGPGTYEIPLSLFRENRLRVCDALKQKHPQTINDKTFALLQGGDAISLYNTDVEYLFKQVILSKLSIQNYRKWNKIKRKTYFVNETKRNENLI